MELMSDGEDQGLDGQESNYVAGHASVYEAVKLMNKNKIGSLVIVRNGETVGI
jgi:predicted transcriptional regulator